MTSDAKTVNDYLKGVPAERMSVMKNLRKVIKENLPEGFKEEMSYGMIGYVVPHALYPPGYHVTPKLPLPFLALASQKNFIALYHMSIGAMPELLAWFQKQYAKAGIGKLDMGKGCIRFKNINKIPVELIAELVKKVTVQQAIDVYEKNLQR